MFENRFIFGNGNSQYNQWVKQFGNGKASSLLPNGVNGGGLIKLQDIETETSVIFDVEKLQQLAEEGDIDKVIEYLDKCGKTYFVEQLDSNRSKVKVDNFTFSVIAKTQGTENTEETKEKTIEERVAERIDAWVNDFKTGYTRWGLDKAPTEAQIKTFREVLTAQCQDKTSLKDTSDNGVHVWVRAKANYAITQIKFNNYVDNLSNMFAKSFADFGLDSTLTADELKEVKTALETKYYSEVENHVASINAKGAHATESNADLEKWLKELVNSALESVKAKRTQTSGSNYQISENIKNTQGTPIYHETDLKNLGFTDEEIAKYFEKNTGDFTSLEDGKTYNETYYSLKTDIMINDKKITTIDELVEALKAEKEAKAPTSSKPTFVSFAKSVLTSKGLTDEEIAKYFEVFNAPAADGSQPDTYILKIGIEIGGKKITTIDELIEALKTEKEAETPTTTTPPTTTTTNSIDYSFVLRKINYVSGHLPDSAKGKSFDPRISAYYGDNNVIGENSDGDKIFNDLLSDIKDAILDVKGENYIKDTIGEANFDALFKSAWVRTVESMNQVPVNSDEFARNVLAKLEEIFKNIQAHPENMSLFTDTSVNTQNLAGYVVTPANGRGIDYTATVNCKEYKQYDTGEYHLDDDNSDKQFQQTMQDLLNRIYDKYPNVDKSILKDLFCKAQGEALDAVSGKTSIYPMTHYSAGSSTNSIRVDTLVDIVMYKFHNLLAEQVLKDGTLKARTETTPTTNPTPKSSQTDAQNEDYKTGASGVKSAICDSLTKEAVLSLCKQANNNNKNFHTEFGIDSNGSIVFQESSTTSVYKQLTNTLKQYANKYDKDAFNKLGEANFDKLVQAAWIMTYNEFNSSTSNDLEKFINKVLDNFGKILDKIASNPELMEVFTKHTSYADSSLTNKLPHYGTKDTYGGDERISYAGAVTVHNDGTVHISNTDDDNDYQTTMNALLQKVIAKYPSVDSKVITNVFRQAQESAIKALQGNIYDCPYGTGNNNGRVEDTSRNWGGKDNRKGDKSYIDMDQLVQMTLYYFDKLLMAEITK